MVPKTVTSAVISSVLVVVATVVGLACVLYYQDWVSLAKSKRYHEHQLEKGVPPTIENYFPGNSLPPQPIVTEFEIVTAEQAAHVIDDDQLVIGVSIGEEARAYPIGMLEGPGREIINDELAGQKIAATWCDMSFNPLVHSREVNGRTLTFRVSGKLWGRNLVMQDDETSSEWSDIIGRSMRGTMVGSQLKTIPSIVTDWGSWKSRYPHTSALNASWITDHYQRRENSFDPSTVIGISSKKFARAWPIKAIGRQRVVNDEFAGKPVVIVVLPGSVGAAVYNRILDGRVIVFNENRGQLIDAETGTEWDPVSGRTDSPKFANQRLERLTGILAHGDVWQMFHPETTVWSPRKKNADNNEKSSN